MRVGIGYDIHRFEEGGRLVLGGVEFDSPLGLVGHSDADAALHAVADAILGAAALGDLGEHFPDTDDRWKDANSRDILQIVMGMLAERSLKVVNVDLNIIAERPRIGDLKGEMRRNIADLLNIAPGSVSVKARTAEGVGPVGRQEALEAQAVVLLEKM
ncbi:MAG: 2-C-methyl-D-erythritol 2,4-cyclodiphosphate synthase [Planctomycetes bacterium]|nr:2-C-methyl-D-erythritol 2,4-cyclodiphosphate synthase [Planctomycetota bacterium]